MGDDPGRPPFAVSSNHALALSIPSGTGNARFWVVSTVRKSL
jgi:hypothetical protein